MKSITPIQAYTTSDGNLYADPIEAQAQQHGLDIKNEVLEYLGFDPQDFDVHPDGPTMYRLRTIIDWEVEKKIKEFKGAANAAQ